MTPLNGSGDVGGMDYEMLTQAFVQALRIVAPELRTNVSADVDKDGLIRFIVQENRSAQRMYGRGLLEV